MSGIGEYEVGKSYPLSGDVYQVPDVQNAVGIGFINLVSAHPIGFEWMCDVCSIEVIGIDVEIAADKRAILIAELLHCSIFANLPGKTPQTQRIGRVRSCC